MFGDIWLRDKGGAGGGGSIISWVTGAVIMFWFEVMIFFHYVMLCVSDKPDVYGKTLRKRVF